MSAAAEALTTCGIAFDSCNDLAVAGGLVRLRDYPLVVWSVGRQNPRNGILTTQTQAILLDYLSGGGKLLLNGAHLAASLDGVAPQSMTSLEDQRFLRRTLGLAYRAMNVDARQLVGVSDGAFQTLPGIMLGAGKPGLIDALPSDVISALEGSKEVLRYKMPVAATAAVAGGGRGDDAGRWVFLAFPFENVEGETPRAELMRAVLQYLQ